MFVPQDRLVCFGVVRWGGEIFSDSKIEIRAPHPAEIDQAIKKGCGISIFHYGVGMAIGISFCSPMHRGKYPG
jgi:hypothetical protein